MLTIWHNPRCSKSRQALELLRTRGVEPRVIDYVRTPPSRAQIEEVLHKLGIPAIQLLRTGDSAYRDSGLNEQSSDREILDAMFHNPILIERPVVFSESSAIVGRPPENVLKLL